MSRTGVPIELSDYFRRDKVIVRDPQRERQYTQVLGEAVIDRFHRDHVVLSSHVVAFVAFRILRQFYPDLDLYGVLRLPRGRVHLRSRLDAVHDSLCPRPTH